MTCTGCPARCCRPRDSVRLGVGLTDLGRDPATVADLVAVLLGPLADLLRLGGPAARGAPAPGDLPTTTTSGRADPWRECIPELASILRIQIDLVGDAVQRKRHRLFGVSSIDIVDEQDANLLGHRTFLRRCLVVAITTSRINIGTVIVTVSKLVRHSVRIFSRTCTLVQLRFGSSLCTPFPTVSGDHGTNCDDEQCRHAQWRRQCYDDVSEAGHQCSNGFTSGNGIVSRIPNPVMAINNRSIPIPSPPDGGIPYSIACRNSSSTPMASSSPRAASRACASKRSRCTTGSPARSRPWPARSRARTGPISLPHPEWTGALGSTGRCRSGSRGQRWGHTDGRRRNAPTALQPLFRGSRS